jgi:hypothetical protein
MISRHVCASLGMAALVLASGCCCHRPAAGPAIVSASPGCCPPAGAPGEPTPVAPVAPPVQSFSIPPPAAIR